MYRRSRIGTCVHGSAAAACVLYTGTMAVDRVQRACRERQVAVLLGDHQPAIVARSRTMQTHTSKFRHAHTNLLAIFGMEGQWPMQGRQPQPPQPLPPPCEEHHQFSAGATRLSSSRPCPEVAYYRGASSLLACGSGCSPCAYDMWV